MLFNVDKCSIMHVGYRNTKVEYKFEGSFLKQSDHERDLGDNNA